MADTQIVASQDVETPSTYVVAPAVEFVLKAVTAEFDGSGAAGDYLPTVLIVSDSGHLIANASDQAVSVVGGDDASVSWFPGVKHAGGASAPEIGWFYSRGLPGAVIPSGVATPLLLGEAIYHSPEFAYDATTGMVTIGIGGFYMAWAMVTWGAFAADRYVEITSDPARDYMGAGLARARGAATPADDVQTTSRVFVINPADAPMTTTLTAFQASGIGRMPAEASLTILSWLVTG